MHVGAKVADAVVRYGRHWICGMLHLHYVIVVHYCVVKREGEMPVLMGVVIVVDVCVVWDCGKSELCLAWDTNCIVGCVARVVCFVAGRVGVAVEGHAFLSNVCHSCCRNCGGVGSENHN